MTGRKFMSKYTCVWALAFLAIGAEAFASPGAIALSAARTGRVTMKAKPEKKKGLEYNLYPDPDDGPEWKNPFAQSKEAQNKRYADLSRMAGLNAGKKAPVKKAPVKKPSSTQAAEAGGPDLGVVLGGGLVFLLAVLASQSL